MTVKTEKPWKAKADLSLDKGGWALPRPKQHLRGFLNATSKRKFRPGHIDPCPPWCDPTHGLTLPSIAAAQHFLWREFVPPLPIGPPVAVVSARTGKRYIWIERDADLIVDMVVERNDPAAGLYEYGEDDLVIDLEDDGAFYQANALYEREAMNHRSWRGHPFRQMRRRRMFAPLAVDRERVPEDEVEEIMHRDRLVLAWMLGEVYHGSLYHRGLLTKSRDQIAIVG